MRILTLDCEPVLNGQGKYYVTRDGRVISLMRKNPVILKNKLNDKGYLHVNLFGHTRYIHRLVAHAFIDGTCTLEINHKDGNPLNNNVENLEFVTHLENMRHAYKLGLIKNPARGERQGAAKLTEEKVLMIRSLLGKGETQRSIAAMFEVGQHTIWAINVNQSWRHV